MAKKKPQTVSTPKRIGIRGDRVRAARTALEWSQFELASRSQIHPSAISQVEKGVKELNALSVVALAKAMAVSSDYLLGLSADSGRK